MFPVWFSILYLEGFPVNLDVLPSIGLAYLLINIYSLKVKEIRPVENPDSLDETVNAAGLEGCSSSISSSTG